MSHFHEINLFLPWPVKCLLTIFLTMFLTGPLVQPFFPVLFFIAFKRSLAEPACCCDACRITSQVLAPPPSADLLTLSVDAHSLGRVCRVPLPFLPAHTPPVLPCSNIIAVTAEAWSSLVIVTTVPVLSNTKCPCYSSRWLQTPDPSVTVSLGLTLQKSGPKFSSANIFDSRNNWFLNFITPLTGCFITL